MARLLPVGDADLKALEARELLVGLRVVAVEIDDVHGLGTTVERHDVRGERASQDRHCLRRRRSCA